MTSLAQQSTLSLLLRVLERRDKVRLGIALVLILISTVMEMASLGLVIPVVQVLVGGDQRTAYGLLPEALSDVSYGAFVQLLMLTLVLLFVAKNAVVLMSSYYQNKIQYSIGNKIVQRLFETYLRQPYEFHLVHSSSVLVRNVQEYSAAVASSGLAPLMMLVTDVITGVGLLAVLFVVQPISTAIMIGVFGVCIYLTIPISRNRSMRLGAERVKHRGILVETLLSGFGGVKEIKIFGRDSEVLETHRQSLHHVARSSALFGVLQSFPRAIFEVMAVGSVALLVSLATVTENSLEDATLIVALFGVVAFRMLPSANRIIQSVQHLAFGRTGIEGAVEGLSLPHQVFLTQTSGAVERFRILEIENLSYRYPNTRELVTDRVSLRVQSGESLGIIGASGSGKSTLVDLLIGVLEPTSGSVSVNGRDIKEDRRYWQNRIGYVPQYVYLMDTTIRRNIAFGISENLIDDGTIEKALRLSNLWDFVQSLPAGINTEVGERGVRLSGGQRQRLGIARALYSNPEVIVLDEATSALDIETERKIVESFRTIAHDHTLIIVAHRISTLVDCNRLIRLESGRVVQEGTFAEIIGSVPNTIFRGQ